MEESILAHKLIRGYLKCFSPHKQNQVARATILIGIQYLMKRYPRALTGDFTNLSLAELEEIVAHNDVKLLHMIRTQKSKMIDVQNCQIIEPRIKSVRETENTSRIPPIEVSRLNDIVAENQKQI